MKYQRFITPSGCKDNGIRKSDFLATTLLHVPGDREFRSRDSGEVVQSSHGEDTDDNCEVGEKVPNPTREISSKSKYIIIGILGYHSLVCLIHNGTP